MLTRTMVRELQPRDRMYEVTCPATPGFVVRVLPSGRKVALVRRLVDGRYRRERIGPLGPALSLDEARRQALHLLRGERPPPPKARAARAAPEEPTPPAEPTPPRPTVGELARRFIREYVDIYLKPSSAEQYRRVLATAVLPALGERAFDSVRRADAQALHAGLRETPGTANYALCVLGSLYRRIITDWELSDMRNPAFGIKRFKLRTRERFLTPEERRRVHEVIQAGLRTPLGCKGHLEPASVWALELLMLTGLRRDEIRELTWPSVDWQHASLHLSDTKTGQRTVPVPTQVVALLRQIHEQTGRPTTGRVIRSRSGRKLTSLNRSWEQIRDIAGIPDVRLHDLRHSFASDALMGGVPLAIVGEMLGHRQAATTKRYAHLADRVVREAIERTAGRIVEAENAAAPASRWRPLSDAQWAAVAPIVGAGRARGGAPVDLRAALDGIRWVLHTGARWRDMPAIHGAATTCWRWHRRWCEDGTWARLEAVLGPSAAPGAAASAIMISA